MLHQSNCNLLLILINILLQNMNQKSKILPQQSIINSFNQIQYKTYQQANPHTSRTIHRQKNLQRKNQWLSIYILVLFASLISGPQCAILFTTGLKKQQMTYTFYSITLVQLFIWTISLCQLTSFKEIVRLSLLLDPILLTELACSSCIMALLYLLNVREWYNYILYGLIFVMNHLFSTNFRVMMVYCQWNKAQVIIYKLVLGISCAYNVCFGVYFLQSGITVVGDGNSDLVDDIKQFISLFTFANFGFSFQMFAKASDFDGTAQLNSNYHLKDPQQTGSLLAQDENNQIKNQKIPIKQKRQNIIIEQQIQI